MRHWRECAFTLVEVMLALVILSIGLYAIVDLVTTNESRSVQVERRMIATELARGKMAELQAAGYGWFERRQLVPPIADARSSPTFYPPQAMPFEVPFDAPNYRWQARLDRDASTSDAVNVEVRVTWYPTLEAPVDVIAQNSVALGGLIVGRGEGE